MKLDKKFDHLLIQDNRYKKWLDDDLFTADINSEKVPYTIVLPPPNVTGKLHLGHAWDGTLQDILIRYKKMNGFEAMWIAGMDHAGIATQAKVDERLKSNGISRHEIGREKFLEYAYNWKDEYANEIRAQWASIGLALDYKQEKFTLDEDVNRSVNKVFVELYNQDLIYQGYRITNWDPVAKTALSDIEVIHKEVEGNFYHFKYMIEGSNTQYLEVATTRPETIFADGAVAVNPEDDRYKHLIGKYVVNPADKRLLEVIADEIALMDFGSGAVKISGAHDPNDYEVCQRHTHLKMPIVMNLDGTMNEHCLEFNKMDKMECRVKLVDKLEKEGLVIKVESHVHNVGHSERTNAIVEPMLTKQWYVRMKELAQKAIDNQQSETKVNFYPPRFNETFLTWMNNINDWCISRQIWWGHQIPVWYNNETSEIYVGENPPENESLYTRDTDVLDTWFSSALWPFSTTIWADKEENIKKFFPTDCLVTGYDILFFWVSRMIFQSLHFTNQVPFKDTLIHGLIRAEDGKKMSKSLGNGVDPQDVVEQYGADALRFFLTTNSSPGQDLRYSQQKVESSWNFINKVWNISRFVLMNTNNENMSLNSIIDDFDCADLFILNNLNKTISHVDKMMDKYEFGEVARCIYNFTWDDFASWYVEISKINLYGEDEKLKLKQKIILRFVLENILKLLHPFMPFVTDAIYEEISEEPIILSSWPKVITDLKTDDNEFKLVKDVVSAIRNMRAEQEIKTSISLSVSYDANINVSNRTIIMIKNLCNLNKFENNDTVDEDVISIVLNDITIHIDTNGVIDFDSKIKKLELQLEKILTEINRSKNMLSNDKFVINASTEKLSIEKDKAKKYISQYMQTRDLLISFEVINEIHESVILLEEKI